LVGGLESYLFFRKIPDSMPIRQWLSSFWRKPRPQRGYFIATATQSNERVRRLGLPVGEGEVLDRSKLSIPEGNPPAGDREYKPEPEFEWVLEVEPLSGGYFAKSELVKVFDKEWRMRYSDATVYGYSLTEKRWTFLSYTDAPERYGRLQVGVSLLGRSPEKEITAEWLTDYVAGLSEAMHKRGLKFDIRESEPVSAALDKAQKLTAMRQELGNDFYVILQSTGDFAGMRVWQVLTDVGLRWGDGDLFHWGNQNRNYGDGQLLSVWTSSEPGYFFPEAIKAGKHHFRDLRFGFVIARNADPAGVYEVLMSAMEYCQGRLGGKIIDRDGLPFDREKGKMALLRVVEGLKALGIEPGEVRALRMF
jgi:cell division protein ZipA